MTEQERTVRIFISSPGDVLEERKKAEQVIEDLQRDYREGVRLKPVLWENMPLPATASFQESIEFILKKHPIDVAVFILWARLGSELGPRMERPDGTPYRSGTEREFDLMLAAHEESGRQYPHIMAYIRDDKSWDRRLFGKPLEEKRELLEQQELLDRFICEHFQDEEGHNRRAYFTYTKPIGFADHLKQHLRGHLDERLGIDDAARRWAGPPFRGLKVFEQEHADIFFGRENETHKLVRRIREQLARAAEQNRSDQSDGEDAATCAFVLIVGASGSGKSSLARAGVAPWLRRSTYDDHQWRIVTFVPGKDLDSDEKFRLNPLCAALVSRLAEAVPELRLSTQDQLALAEGLAKDPTLTLKLTLRRPGDTGSDDPLGGTGSARAEDPDNLSTSDTDPALAEPEPVPPDTDPSSAGGLCVLLILDQLEELWTGQRITDTIRQQFLEAVAALTRTGWIAALGTLRSDFYPQAQTSLLPLKGEHGHFDLLAPNPTALHRMITQPARRAGLRFERQADSETTLDQQLSDEAWKEEIPLPLLEYALDELDRQREPDSRTLTFAAMKALGGLKGALGNRAAAVFDELPPDVQAALEDILPLLVTVQTTESGAVVRRWPPLAELQSTPARRALTEALIQARFLTTDKVSGANGMVEAQVSSPTLDSDPALAKPVPPRPVPPEIEQIRTDEKSLAKPVPPREVQTSTGTDDQALAEPVPPREIAVVSFSHEALLTHWPRVAEWATKNQQKLAMRARVQQHQQVWEEKKHDPSLLLPVGLSLEEGRQLLAQGSELIDDATRDYIRQSIDYHRRLKFRRRLIALGLLLLVGIVGSAAYYEFRARELVTGLLNANVDRITEFRKQLGPYSWRADRMLKQKLTDVPTTDEEDKQKLAEDQLKARIGLVERYPEYAESLQEDLLNTNNTKWPYEYLGVIGDALQDAGVDFTPHLWKMFHDKDKDNSVRFRAGLALAKYDADSDDWSANDYTFLVEQLVRENPINQQVLYTYVQDVSERLLLGLERIFADESATDAQRLNAANALAVFASEDIARLCRLLSIATPEQYDILYPMVAASPGSTAVTELARIAKTPPGDDLGSEKRVPFGQHRANAAAALLRLGAREKVLPVFEMTDDPEALTQFIFRCRPRGVKVDALLDCLQLVSNGPGDRYPPHARYALLLALGEFSLDEIPASRRESLLKQLAEWYANDPISGVHGAAGWLLRHWDQTETARKIEQTEVPYSPDREWFTLAIAVTPTSPPEPENPEEVKDPKQDGDKKDDASPPDDGSEANEENPSADEPSASKSESGNEPPELPKKTFYYTFIVFPAGDYWIGSVEDEPDRLTDETRHQVELTRPFAVLDREITFEELLAFQPSYEGYMWQVDAEPKDAGIGVNWYEPVYFCWWLGTQMGLSEAEQAYAFPETLDRTQYPRETAEVASWAPKNWPVELGRRGFRLPTESEWEVATRAGARTAYSYGSDVHLLDRFGWFVENSGRKMHRPKQRRPNLRGLFDLHGNAFEWTHDWYGDDYGSEALTDPKGPETGSSRVVRGGCWGYFAADCRTASRNASTPAFRSSYYGFRLVLSPSVGSPEAKDKQAEPGGEGPEGASAEQRPKLP